MKTNVTTAFIAVLLGISPVKAQNYLSNPKHHHQMEAFQINISQEKINELNSRISKTRWISETAAPVWGDPILDYSTIKALTDYWGADFEWKKHEAHINNFPQFRAFVKDINIHFVYQKGNGSGHIPILFLHGWASNFNEFLKTAELIGKENPGFDVIIPSLPGFAFSDVPESMDSATAAEYIHHLMTGILGYEDYYVHGSDYGAFVGEKLALKYPESVKGLHLSDIPFYHLYSPGENLSQSEKDYIEKINDWSMRDGTYGMIQGTKPQTLSIGLNDSPVALAAWILQLYFDLGDKELSIFERFSKDDLLVNISLYWFTESIYPSIRLYSEDLSGYDGKPVEKVTVPVAFNLHRFDISGFVPKAFAERFYANIVSYTEFKDGGHFSGLSHPEQLKNNLIDFIEQIEENKTGIINI
ncbi:epoxide hydrolase family protein [Anditalea andensis]|uniref:Epoxide hydrolase N-terminal domain-containing protein n=1 Tax=Anditalea andensis TaxID=1048983 RepID=A0A074KUV6_9BACT|nr:epoxide hydrolase family protein [Anditalea andensis]KEO72664.1 hypothetical protein EL17_18160 [Anditalea andensis]